LAPCDIIYEDDKAHLEVKRLEKYDVLIIGSDIASLTSALFLARKMRSVSVLVDEKADAIPASSITLTDPENNKYQFDYDRGALLPGLHKPGLIHKYTEAIGLKGEIKGDLIESDFIIREDGSFRRRDYAFDRYKVYLVRYYPKQRDAIHKFFRDLEKHYDNYVSQQQNMINNREYTLTSLMIEWGDYPLSELLQKYFSDPEIINEFILNHQINGIDPSEVNSYHFFSQLFLELKEGLYRLRTSHADIRNLLIEKLNIIDPKLIQKRRIKEYIYDDSGKITEVIDYANKKIVAKHFVVNSKPDLFFKTHFPSFADDIETIESYYPNINTGKRKNTIYLALNQKPSALGITELTYHFPANTANDSRILSLFNYSLYDPNACPVKNGMLCLDYAFNENTAVKQDELLAELFHYFPKLKKTIVAIKEGVPTQLLANVSREDRRKGLSINKQIEIEAGEHLRFFENLHLIGSWQRPEAGLYGCFHSGIFLADQIEEILYFGEDDDTFYYLTNDEIMMMIRHNYGKKLLGKTEIHTNFHIGKTDYFVRTKAKNITIHRGEYPNPDLSIYTTNDKLSNLLLKKVTFDEVLQGGGFRYTGNTDLLYEVVSAFELSDYRETEPRFQPRTKIRNLGSLFLFAYLLIFSAVALTHNFVDMIWLAPFALGAVLALGFIRMRLYRKLNWFEYVWAAIYLSMTVMAIFWPQFNTWRNDDALLGLMGGGFFITWLINKPIVYDFRKYDFRQDYADSKLFKVVSNGINFVWALFFLGILAGTYLTGDDYVSAWYNLVFMGIFLTFIYPLIYVRTNIK